MRALVLGSGGREHALAWRLANSPSVDAVESAPGNPGMAELGPCHRVQPLEPHEVARLVQRRHVDLVVVGPEAPLVVGVVDELRGRGIPVFGPSAAAARIEGSKSFAKEVMAAVGAPTARYGVYDDAPSALEALEGYAPPYVVKADGLAAGKGVVICGTRAEAHSAIEDALVRRVFGEAGQRIVLEEYLEGPEVSVFAVCDGRDLVMLPPAQDFKRAYDGDRGPNTGGMGAYSPVAGFGLDEARELGLSVLRGVIAELARRGTPYVGLLYAGLALTSQGPKILEFNCRFGDPETQVVVPRIRSDFGALLASAVDPTRGVQMAPLSFSPDAFVTVVLSSGGYPGTYEVGRTISGLDLVAADHPDVLVFHAGTRHDDGRLVTAGGRVLAVTGRGPDVAAARDAAYAAADLVRWEGMHRREDIAAAAARAVGEGGA
ncbi:MAG: phosphoribosylamine--glycine ligase [Actinomycetota bacterium]|nr:phosphoribosylamine--glycine ligase [Actinomycetota bacterium]